MVRTKDTLIHEEKGHTIPIVMNNELVITWQMLFIMGREGKG